MIVNVAVVAPAGTVIEARTWATDVRLLVNVTTIPPAGAGPVNVTVQDTDAAATNRFLRLRVTRP